MNARTSMSRLLAMPRQLILILMPALLLLAAGCQGEPEIVQYKIDTRQPEGLKTEQRMIGAIVPQSEAVWFFKIVGPATDVEPVVEEVRQWVAEVEFNEGDPVLELPAEWTRRDGGAMRFATVEIPTEGELPLEMSVSELSRGDEWNELVAMNVNRWRGQMGLEPSEEPFAGAEPLTNESTAAEGEAIAMWVDLSGTFGGGPSSMAPFAGGAPFAAGGPPQMPFAGNGPAAPESAAGDASPSAADGGQTGSQELTYETPEGWRPGKMSAMRLVAFNVGPEDREAELTVIPAGGDVRGNVRRWLGQIRPEGVDDELLDKVIDEAQEVTVDGRTGQRFLLPGSGDKPSAIDATIVPLEEGRSLFIKLTGDAQTVAEQSDELGTFLESFQMNR